MTTTSPPVKCAFYSHICHSTAYSGWNAVWIIFQVDQISLGVLYKNSPSQLPVCRAPIPTANRAKTIRMPNCDPVWVHVRRRLSFFHLCTHVRLHSRRTLATATNERRGYRISHSRLGIRPTVYTSHTAGEGERERSARALRAHAYIAVCLRAWVVSGSRTQTSQLPHTFLRFVIRFVSLLCVVS